ncbi:MAG: mechanosensitive ion channel [Actinomycetaceae bacterium]|nr:mechanosensitive ion channel [Actinomycetaceae bacterium]
MDNNTEEAVQEAFDVLQLLLGVAIGVVGALVIGVAVWVALRVVSRRTESFSLLMRRVKIPFFALFLVAGAWVGLNYTNQVLTTDTATWIPPLQHTLLIITIVMVSWMCYASAYVIEDVAEERKSATGSRRLATQAQMVRRIVQLGIVILGMVAIILTFPSARVAMGSILASAGVISLVAGIAAQDSLSNTFAGLQITFTDAIRVGDVVTVDDQFGTIEEITLTYVVVRVWDDRRAIVPSTHFTQNKFENWTRQHTKLAGTVELKLDWRAPVPLIRREVERLLEETDLWDRRSSSVQVTDSTDEWILVRVAVTAKDSGDLWDLRCYLRENLIEWIVEHAPYAIARTRVQREEVVEVNLDRSEKEIVALANELREIERVGDEVANADEAAVPETKHEARVQAAKQRASKVRRRRLRDRKVNVKTLRESESTHVLSAAELEQIQRELAAHPVKREEEAKTSTVGDRLFSGSEEAEKRSKRLAGPSEEDQRRRVENQTLRALRLGDISEEQAVERLGGGSEAEAKVASELSRIKGGKKE